MRARNIKPGLFKNEHLAECRSLARLLFAGLWCMADREGRLEDRPKRIKAELLPYDDVDTNELLNDLARHDFILRYTVDEAAYIQVLNFKKHQNPHVNEGPSTIPAPDSHGASTVQAPDKNHTNPADTGSLIPDTRESAPKKSARTRTPANDMWDQFVEHLATEPKTKSERSKWNGAIKELLDAEVLPEHVPRLIRQYRIAYGSEIDCNPRAIVGNLSSLQAVKLGPNGALPSRYKDLKDVRRERREQVLRAHPPPDETERKS